MTIHDVIIAKLRQLPDPLAKQVNEFIDSLMVNAQTSQNPDVGSAESSKVYQVGTAWVVESTPVGDLSAAIASIREERTQLLMADYEHSV